MAENGEPRVGVYVCHCGFNIAATVDVEAVRDEAATRPNVVSACDYQFMCSNAGQDLIKQDIQEKGVNRVVVAACSPLMHEPTFRAAAQEADLNPYLVQIANIREQCAWVHDDREAATTKAASLVNGAIGRVALHEPLDPTYAEMNPATLVVGGGIAGIQAALNISEAGNDVYLVERKSTIGGMMAKFDKTFPTLDCAACILTPKMVSAERRENLHLMTMAEVESVEGFVGNFKVKVRNKARFVTDACTSCGECLNVCPVNVPDPFNEYVSTRHAIHKAFPQAIPSTYVIEKQGSPPCMEACPIHQNAAGYVALIADGRFEEAAKLIRKRNPLPFVCGRVCYHPCETACSRGKVDDPVAIRGLKRLAMDWEREHIPDPEPAPAKHDYVEKIAVIGSGPAGLTCAFDLAQEGYQVTVFEKHDKLGGMLAVGLPDYRCPPDIVARDLDYIRKTGVDFQTGVELGVDFKLADLLSDKPEFGFGAVFMALGAHRGLQLRVPGEDAEDVTLGIDYLREINLGRAQPTGKKVAVIGGGNTAMDVARTARRQGADVAILYRRTAGEMPADLEEVEGAIAEGVRFDYLVSPLEVIVEDGKVTGLRCMNNELGEPDESGRARPVPIEGSEHIRDFDMVIPSVSQQPFRTWYKGGVPEKGQIGFSKWDTLVVEPESLQTGVPGVFGGGDVVLGPASIVEAMGQGRRAAEAIDKYLRGKPLEDFSTHVTPPDPVRGFVKRPYEHGPTYDQIEKIPRARLEARDPAARLADYDTVDIGLTEEEGIREASRCLHCGVCVECESCQNICPPDAVRLDMKDEFVELEVGQILVSTGFKSFDPARMTPYGYGRYDNVVTSAEFERMLNSTGPTGGQILCKNGKPPRSVAIVHCVGSRDENYNRYCSRVCCMAALKFAHLVKDRTDAELYEFYIDMRAFGKGYEEFYLRVLEEGANVIRGKVVEVMPARRSNGEGGHLVVRAEDTLIGRYREIPVDMVVLMGAIEPQPDAEQVGRVFSLSRSPDGFFLERHPKLDPVGTTTDGVYVAGCAQGPKDIPDTVAQAQAAAANILAMISKGEVIIEPVRATVQEHLCGGCKTCLGLCPYTAISFDEEHNNAVINQALCKGCGTCVAACPAAAITGAGFTDEQILAELDGILAPILSGPIAQEVAT